MKVSRLLFSMVILASVGTNSMVTLAEETSTTTETAVTANTVSETISTESTSSSSSVENNETETTASSTETSTTEASQEAEEGSEEINNTLTDGETLTHTHQADLSEFSGRAAFARASTTYQQTFINSVAPSAKSLASANDLYASVMIAQAIVESGWGRSTLSAAPNYNLFGIKGSYNGQSVTMKTSEYLNGKWVTVNAAFRKYPSYKESLQDNVNILKKTSFSSGVYYYSGAWKSNTKSYKDATAYLTGRYATAPNYATILNSVIATYNLTQYDTTSSNNGNNTSTATQPMYRLYNPNTGEHLYTLNAGEKNYLPTLGWKYEGVSWQAPKTGNPVYRMYNPNSGDHHYTSTMSEVNFLKKVGWKFEGTCFYSGGSKGVLRLFNPNEQTGTHHYTMSTTERNYLVKLGWKYEGIGFYGY